MLRSELKDLIDSDDNILEIWVVERGSLPVAVLSLLLPVNLG
jgi:hypothetical protein